MNPYRCKIGHAKKTRFYTPQLCSGPLETLKWVTQNAELIFERYDSLPLPAFFSENQPEYNQWHTNERPGYLRAKGDFFVIVVSFLMCIGQSLLLVFVLKITFCFLWKSLAYCSWSLQPLWQCYDAVHHQYEGRRWRNWRQFVLYNNKIPKTVHSRVKMIGKDEV